MQTHITAQAKEREAEVCLKVKVLSSSCTDCVVTLQREAFGREISSLEEQVGALRTELEGLREAKAETDKEQEDVSHSVVLLMTRCSYLAIVIVAAHNRL